MRHKNIAHFNYRMKHGDMRMLDVRLVVLTTATMNSIVFSDVTPCIVVGADWCYEGRCCRNLKVKE